MSKYVFMGGLGMLLVLGLSACGSQTVDLEATIESLNTTITVQQQHQATLEAELNQPTSSPTPTPTRPVQHRPTVALSTPKPVQTVQRPPTMTATNTPLPTATATATATPIPDASVGETLTNLRSGPSVGYPILAEIPAFTSLDVLGKSVDQEWLKVQTPDGQQGWMFTLPLIVNIPLDTIPVTE